MEVAREGSHKPCIHACMYVCICVFMHMCVHMNMMYVCMFMCGDQKTALICHACLVPKSGSCNEPGSSS